MSNFRDYFQFKKHYIVSADTAKSLSYFVESVDLNQDGNKDLIFFGFTSPTMSKTETPQKSLFYWGTGSSNYALASAISISLPATSHPREIAYADFNKDGKLDIFLADHGWDTMPFPGGQNQLILSSPTGWISGTSYLPTRTDFTHCTAVGDINNDGKVDIFLGNVSTGSSQFNASILFGDGTGQFIESTTAVPSEIRGPIRFYAAQLADLNRDGWVDLIIGNSGDANNSKSQSIVYWNKNGVFNNVDCTLLPNGFFGAKNEQILDIQSADVNGDGSKDLVLLSTQNNPYYDGWSIQILSNQGNAFVDITSEAFGSNVSSMGTPNQAKQMPWVPFLKLVDLNNDGTLDILFDSIKNYNSASPETQALFYLNDGFGHYTPIFANDILDLNASYKDFFANASSYVNESGISWVSYFAYQDSIYFRELTQTKPLLKIITITGSTGADSVVANELDNTLFGLAGNDVLDGGLGNDVMDGGSGNDSINGGVGVDTVIVSGPISRYSVKKIASGYTQVDKTGSDGVDTLVNVESIKFSDKTINLTVQAKAASAPQADVTRLVELYTAFFNRVPDADGMSFWIDEMKSGKTTNQVAEAFYNAGVNYSSLTGFSSTMTNADFINVIYKNVLGRKDGADTGGLSFWETEITSGRASRGTLVTNILDSAHTFKGNATWGWVADLLDNKITVAKKFSIDMGLNYNTPEESISKGMAIASAITSTDTTAAVTLIGVAEANLLLV